MLGYKFYGVPLSAAAGFKAHSKFYDNLRGDRNLTPQSESLELHNQVHNYKLRERDGGNSEGLVDKCWRS